MMRSPYLRSLRCDGWLGSTGRNGKGAGPVDILLKIGVVEVGEVGSVAGGVGRGRRHETHSASSGVVTPGLSFELLDCLRGFSSFVLCDWS